MKLVQALAIASGVVLGACGGGDGGDDDRADADTSIIPDPDRDVLSTFLEIDLENRDGTATVVLGPSESTSVSLEIGDLHVTSVALGIDPLPFFDAGDRLDIAVPANPVGHTVTIEYRFGFHDTFQGIDEDGFTLTWPYYCGNMFPCHSNPADGTQFALTLTGVPDDQVAIYPTVIAAEAPSYQLAWAIGDYTELDLGTTAAGTQIVAYHRPTETATITAGTEHLRAAFEWLEQTIGPYRFGTKAGTVAVSWGSGAFGGMEHHPFWHVAAGALASDEVNVHEAAHGWFGDGIRIGCWEDFVLSEGTVTYLAGRALEVVAPEVGAEVWASYTGELAGIPPGDPVWPAGCNAIDILDDNLFTNAPYIRGAFFYRAVALRVGAEELDAALGAFYTEYAGQPARMSDMLRVIEEETGFDPADCADAWLRGAEIPDIEACPD